ncbi:hypothetical protein QZN31_01870 [Burkholderia multivorans]|nr:hypothetical protein [Burkholderia multivorans]MDN7756166.1 hypothetical protein [Burkholderia multivorans]MDN8098982.1 hypothetical protein [Burkholderia multivorans]
MSIAHCDAFSERVPALHGLLGARRKKSSVSAQSIHACARARAVPLTIAASGIRHPASKESVMRECCLSRAACATRSRAAAPRTGGPLAGIGKWCARVVGWHRLERLLASIPDSNDDFGLG